LELESNGGGGGGGGRDARKRAKTTSSDASDASDDASDSDGAVSETSDADDDDDDDEDAPRLTQSEEIETVREIVSDVSRRRMADAKRNPGDRACALCRNPLAGTPPAQIECEYTPGAKDGDITLAHTDCFLYAPKPFYDDDVVLENGSIEGVTVLNGGRMAKDILKEKERCKQLKCYACKKTGACTGCHYAPCQARPMSHRSPYDPVARSRGVRRSLRTFPPGARFSPPRVPRFRSRHTAMPFNASI
jgi:hypothetical protein